MDDWVGGWTERRMGDWVIMGLWVMWVNKYAVHGERQMSGRTEDWLAECLAGGWKDRGMDRWCVHSWTVGK